MSLEGLEKQFKLLTTLHADAYEEIVKQRKAISANSLEDLADMASYLNDMEKLADDIRKEFKQLSELAQKTACMLWSVISDGSPIEGKRCKASPTIRQMCALPTKARDPENYSRLLLFLGVPEERIDEDLVHISWPKFVEYMTNRAEQGLPNPPGLELAKTYSLYQLQIRKVKA